MRKLEGGEEVGEGDLEQKESLCTPNPQEKGIPLSASSLVLDLTIVRMVKLRLWEAELLGGLGMPTGPLDTLLASPRACGWVFLHWPHLRLYSLQGGLLAEDPCESSPSYVTLQTQVGPESWVCL